MTAQAAFLNRVRSLFNIDGYLLPELSEEQQQKFMRDPVRYLMGANTLQAAAIWREVEKRQRPNAPAAEFAKEDTGAVVAPILSTDSEIVEVQELRGGKYALIIHSRRSDTGRWDDLTAHLSPEHFDRLGSVADQMRARAGKS